MAGQQATIVFAGGGSGGHIFPNIAILERLRERGVPVAPRFLISRRPLDLRIVEHDEVPFTPLPVRPFSVRPWNWLRFSYAFWRSVRQAARLMREQRVACVVATGGFVSGPAMRAARRCGIPAALVNLDAVPGRANRYAADLATITFSAYATRRLSVAAVIGMPLRRCVIGPDDASQARRALGLDPQRHTLLITGASQGAGSFNRMMIELVRDPQRAAAFRTPAPAGSPAPGNGGGNDRAESKVAHSGGSGGGGEGGGGWQVFHLSGEKDLSELRAAYTAAGIKAKVEPFCHKMGMAWRAASIAISRAGAGSVAEVWANATPTIFLPYPFHRDQHQKLNAAPLIDAGAARLMPDKVDPAINAQALALQLFELMGNAALRRQMVEKMNATRPPDGAAVVADWLIEHIRHEPKASQALR